jgi:hypothetical protein
MTDIDREIAKLTTRGVLAKPADDIHERLIEAISIAHPDPPRDASAVGDWAREYAAKIEQQLHAELCAPDGTGLSPTYDTVLDTALSPKGIASVTAVVLKVVSAVNPVIAVSSVGVYFAVWLLKRGLIQWCKVPPTTRG